MKKSKVKRNEIQKCLAYLKENMAKSNDVEQLVKYVNKLDTEYQSFLADFQELKDSVNRLQEGKPKRLFNYALGAVEHRVNRMKEQRQEVRKETLSYLKWNVHCYKNKIAVKTSDTLKLSEKLNGLRDSLVKVSNAITGFTLQFGRVVEDGRATKNSIKKLIGVKTQKQDGDKVNAIHKLLINSSICVMKMQNHTENAIRRLNNMQRQSVHIKLQQQAQADKKHMGKAKVQVQERG